MADQNTIAGLIFDWRRLVLRVTGAAAVVAVVVSLLLPNWYAATSTALPPHESRSGGTLVSMFTQLGMDLGASGLLSTTPATDVMIGVLKSRYVRGQVVDRFNLVAVYGSETRDHAVKELGDHVRVNTTAEGLIEVQVEDKDRQRAADMANAFMEFLDEYHREASVDQARRTREFVETALLDNRVRLEAASGDLRAFQESHGTIELTEQTRATVEALAALQTEHTALSIRRGVLASFATPDQVEIRGIDVRLEEIGSQISLLTGGSMGDSAGTRASTGALIPLSDIPGIGLELADLTREVVVRGRVLEFLSSQLEEARIQESKDLEIVSTLDTAVPPLKKIRPRRSIICILTVVLALAGSIGVAALAEFAGSRLESGKFLDAAGDTMASRAIVGFVRWLAVWGKSSGSEAGASSLER